MKIAVSLQGHPDTFKELADGCTVAEAAQTLGLGASGYSCRINDEPALPSDEIPANSFVAFGTAAKAG